MTRRVPLSTDQVTPLDTWNHYQSTRDTIVRTARIEKRNISEGIPTDDPELYSMTGDELDRYFDEILDETDTQACLFLIASAEAALRVDFLCRVYNRGRDDVSRAFRSVYVRSCRHSKPNVRLDEDILNIWTAKVPGSKSTIGEFRGALNYRHWLAHGRYWVPKLGRRYDPAGVLQIITRLFSEIGLADH